MDNLADVHGAALSVRANLARNGFLDPRNADLVRNPAFIVEGSGRRRLYCWVGGRYTGTRTARRRSRAKLKWEMSALRHAGTLI